MCKLLIYRRRGSVPAYMLRVYLYIHIHTYILHIYEFETSTLLRSKHKFQHRVKDIYLSALVNIKSIEKMYHYKCSRFLTLVEIETYVFFMHDMLS